MTNDLKRQNSCHVVLTFSTKQDAMKWFCDSAGEGFQQGTVVSKTVECDWSDADMLADDVETCRNAVTKTIEFYTVHDDDDDSVEFWMNAE